MSLIHCLFTVSVGTGQVVQQLSSGRPGAQQALPSALHVLQLSCSGPTTCFALGFEEGQANSSVVFSISPTTGKAAAPLALSDFSGDAIECLSAGPCLVVGIRDGSAEVVTVDGGKVVATVSYPGDTFDDAACTLAGTCYAVGHNGTEAVIVRLAA